MISIIVPTYNEAGHIKATIEYILKLNDSRILEIIIVDGSSDDNTLNIAQEAGAITLKAPVKGRAAQMNYAVGFAKGDILYFLHADSLPPPNFTELIYTYFNKGYQSGCFRLKFDKPHWFINTVALLTRLNTRFIRFGDQSLYVTKSVFKKINGYNEGHIVMEDHEIINRIKKVCKFKLMPYFIVTSSRKFMENGPTRLMLIFLYIYTLYYIGKPQGVLVNTYRKMVSNGKL